MIIIFSTQNDVTTQEICKWLTSFKTSYKVIYPETLLKSVDILEFSKTNILTYLEGVFGVSIEDITVFWCRKWSLNEFLNKNGAESYLSLEDSYTVKSSVVNELKVLSELFFSVLPEGRVVNNFYNKKTDKLNQLLLALECGLRIPKSSILSSKSDVARLREHNKAEYSLITKPMHEGFGIELDGNRYTTFTSVIKEDIYQSNTFLPGLVQTEIKKKYEVRAFVLEDSIYSMAIFSQQNDKTKVDFRQYDRLTPNKLAPYCLPKDIKEKIISFCRKMDLKTGSVDFIVDDNDEHYFLEINPYGQFGMVSKPNNYNLEFTVAKYLCNYGKD